MTKNAPQHQTETNCITPTDVIAELYLSQDGKYELSLNERHEQILRIAAKHDLATLHLNEPIILGRGPTHSVRLLTALGKRCVDAYKSGNWGAILHSFRDSGKEPTLEEMITAICGKPSEVTTPCPPKYQYKPS